MRASWMIATVVVVLARPALAEDAARFLELARTAHNNLDYDLVIPLLERALEASPDESQEVEIYGLLAEMHVLFGHEAEAAAAFVELLRLEPDYQLPEHASPKVVAAFDAARAEVVAPAPPEEKKEETIVAATVEPPTTPPPAPVAPPPAPAPVGAVELYETWWFWTAVGVVALGTGLVAWQLNVPPEPHVTFGPYRVGR